MKTKMLLTMTAILGTLASTQAMAKTLWVNVVNKTSKPLTIFVDTNCAPGPGYQQGVDAHSTRPFTWESKASGSCFFEASIVQFRFKDVPDFYLDWQTNFDGWARPWTHG